jgi:putative ABC transport system permease protein
LNGRFRYEAAEAIRIAFEQIWAHRLRASLTALGVIIGIAAVTLMGTAIHGIDLGFNQSLAMLGEDVLYIQKWPWEGVEDWWNYLNRPPLRPEDAWGLNQVIGGTPHTLLDFAVPVFMRSTSLKAGKHSVGGGIIGTSEGYGLLSTVEFSSGRLFNELEVSSARQVCVLGDSAAQALFPDEPAIGQTVFLGRHPFEVIGVLAHQGAVFGTASADGQVLIPISAFQKFYSVRNNNSQLRVKVKDKTRMADAREELVGAMRRVRGQMPGERDNFSIEAEEALKARLSSITSVIALAGIFVTGLALFVGAIGIMNITFVSVKERTREIGTRKALGARRRAILLQFLTEAVVICFLGGVAGLGLTFGLSIALRNALPHLPLIFSASLVGTSLLVAVLTGVVAGFVPAIGASRLDPVDALRYE